MPDPAGSATTGTAAGTPAAGGDLIRVANLSKHYPVLKRGILWSTQVGSIAAVDDISFAIRAGETLGLVGESGCGKTTTARAILRLIEPTSGSVLHGGTDVLQVLAGRDRAAILATRRRLQYVFQDPYLSLNPRWTIGQILQEPLRVHGLVPERQWGERVSELLELVGLEPYHASRYPHEFSGGQRQRVGIARALAVSPEFIICDEPVSSLDVSVRAQILNLLVELQERLGLTYLYISHDLSSVRFVSNRVAVMYLGKIVEIAGADALFDRPMHHYTHALLAAIVVPDPDGQKERMMLKGEVPSAMNKPSGCRFRTRCHAAQKRCEEVEPQLTSLGADHLVACHFPR